MNFNLLMMNQPLYAFIEVTIGDLTVTDFTDDFPDCVMSLDYTRTIKASNGSAGNKFTLNFFDDTAIEVEAVLASTQDISVKYGWTGRGKVIREDEFEGRWSNYSLDFEGPSTTLTVEGTVSGDSKLGEDVRTKDYSASKYGGKPSEVFKAVCKEVGVKVGMVEDTEPEYDEDGETPKTFRRTDLSAKVFITNYLCEEATSAKTGDVGYCFYTTRDENGDEVWNFTSNKAYDTFSTTQNIISDEELNQIPEDDSDGDSSVGESESDEPVGVRLKSNVILGANNGDRTTVYIGDSRLVGMYNTVTGGNLPDSVNASVGDTAYIGKVGAGYSWFSSTGMSEAQHYLDNGNCDVVLLMGVNDCANANAATQYTDYLSKNLSSLTKNGNSVTFATVGPMSDGDNKSYNVSNANIQAFNKTLLANLPKGVKSIDLYNALNGNFKTTDGLHYNDETYRKMSEALGNGGGSSGSGSSGSSGGSSGNSKDINANSEVGNQSVIGTYADDEEIDWYYEYYSGSEDNVVLSFSPEYTRYTALSQNLAKAVYTVDTVRNQMTECAMSIGNSTNGPSQAIDEFKGTSNFGLSTSSFQDLQAKALGMWNENLHYLYQASMEILGDLDVQPNDRIYVAVYTKYGFLHHTSGRYTVSEVEHTIEGGNFTTSLSLYRSASAVSIDALNGDSSDSNYNFSGSSDVAPNGDVQGALDWARGVANNNNIYYEWGGDGSSGYNGNYDCSGFVCAAFKGFGVSRVPTQGMINEFTKHGFTWIPRSQLSSSGNIESGLQAGDVLLNIQNHTEIYSGNGKVIGAHTSPSATVSQADSLSEENYWDDNWDGVLRYTGN